MKLLLFFIFFISLKKFIRNYQQNIFCHYLHRKLTTKFFISIFVAIYQFSVSDCFKKELKNKVYVFSIFFRFSSNSLKQKERKWLYFHLILFLFSFLPLSFFFHFVPKLSMYTLQNLILRSNRNIINLLLIQVIQSFS